MNLLIRLIFFILFFLLILNKPLFSQHYSDSVFYNRALDSAKAFYVQEAGANLSLYNGSEYYRSPVSTKGFPFFKQESLIEGSVFYDGNLYEHVNLQYDIAKDELVIKNFQQNATIKLISQKVKHFTLQQHSFVYFLPDNKAADIMPEGFYEKLLSSNISVLAKRQKKFTLALNADDNSSKYSEYNSYFLQKQDGYFAVTDKRSLLTVLNDRKSQLKQYIRDNKISFTKDLEDAIIKIVMYYNQQKN
jgi:hypothetical protein